MDTQLQFAGILARGRCGAAISAWSRPRPNLPLFFLHARAGVCSLLVLEQPVLHPECRSGVRRPYECRSCGGWAGPRQPGRLWFCLAGYTLLLATTACFLIRVGKLWDDLRSLLLLIVMMFLAMATTGDDVMAADPRRGAIGCLGGIFFAVVVTESVLHAIRLRLPGGHLRRLLPREPAWCFFLPYRLCENSEPAGKALRLDFAPFGFSPLAGCSCCWCRQPGVVRPMSPRTAARGAGRFIHGRSSSSSPVASGRSELLDLRLVSLREREAETIFGPYFLVPIGLAVSLVWLEIASAAQRPGVMFAASVVPLVLAFVAATDHRYEPIYMNFSEDVPAHPGGLLRST